MALISGLVSITFRKLSPREIVELAARAGLRTIEWGGDVHVPHGDLAAAREAAQLTRAAGLTVAAYGSYYRCAESENEGPAFGRVLETAVAIGAQTVRIWAGRRASAAADADYRAAVAADARRVAALAAAAGLTVSLEYHANTLTDTCASAQALLAAANHAALRTYWQPAVGAPPEGNLRNLGALLPRLTNVHVFHWEGNVRNRRPLADGKDCWPAYLAALAESGCDHGVLLEFVRDDDPAQLAADAATLKGWLEAVSV